MAELTLLRRIIPLIVEMLNLSCEVCRVKYRLMKRPNRAAHTILVVDDDMDQLACARMALEPSYTVLTATSDTEAIRLAASAKPDVIILDVMLQGGQNGFSVFRDLGDDPVTSGIPVIFLTGVNQTNGLSFGTAELGRYLGREPVAFLEKPLAPENLLREVSKAIA